MFYKPDLRVGEGFRAIRGRKDDLAIRREIGYLPEHNPLYFDMYVKEYLGFVANLCGITKHVTKRVDETVIARTGLEREQTKKDWNLVKRVISNG